MLPLRLHGVLDRLLRGERGRGGHPRRLLPAVGVPVPVLRRAGRLGGLALPAPGLPVLHRVRRGGVRRGAGEGLGHHGAARSSVFAASETSASSSAGSAGLTHSRAISQSPAQGSHGCAGGLLGLLSVQKASRYSWLCWARARRCLAARRSCRGPSTGSRRLAGRRTPTRRCRRSGSSPQVCIEGRWRLLPRSAAHRVTALAAQATAAVSTWTGKWTCRRPSTSQTARTRFACDGQAHAYDLHSPVPNMRAPAQVGREKPVDIVINVPTVSGHHAMLRIGAPVLRVASSLAHARPADVGCPAQRARSSR